MLNAVFTGPAYDGSGNSIVRSKLVAACQKSGRVTVKPKVDGSTHVLVASRVDTVKAVAAHTKGVLVLTYPEFINRYLSGVDIEKGGQPNRYTDTVVQDLLVPDFTPVFTEDDVL